MLTQLIRSVLLMTGAALFSAGSQTAGAEPAGDLPTVKISPKARVAPPTAPEVEPVDDYADKVGEKLGIGASNVALGWLEIPKNMGSTFDSTSVDSPHFALAFVGAPIKGVMHSASRILSGVVDLVTAPFPTQSFATPSYPWETFDGEKGYATDTRYGAGTPAQSARPQP